MKSTIQNDLDEHISFVEGSSRNEQRGIKSHFYLDKFGLALMNSFDHLRL